MNCTILNLFLKLSTQNSPLLMGTSYSLQNKLSLEKIKISYSFSQFYNSYAINSLKLNAKMSSFSHFLDAAFRIDSQPIQYFGEKFVGEQKYESDLSFESCFFINISFYSGLCVNLKYESCFFLGKYNDIQLFPVDCNFVMNHCYLEDFGCIKCSDCKINDTSHNLCKATYFIIHSSGPMECIYTNFTNIDAPGEMSTMFAQWFNINYIIYTKNYMYSAFQNEGDTYNTISNSIFYNNTLVNSINSPFDEFLGYVLTVENTCMFVNSPSEYINSYCVEEITLHAHGCCFSHSEDEIKNALKFGEVQENVFFSDCSFNTNECKLSNLNDMVLPPSRKKFNYKVIGDLEEEFEYEIKNK